MLTRAILNRLDAWRKRPHHPLVLRGLRQTGKTFSVKEFGKSHYENVVFLDLRQNTSVHEAFAGDFDVDSMVLSITSKVATARFVPGRTLLVLDEIQDCPNARSSLKYWDLDGRYDVIATGSFLGVKGFRDPYPRGIPVGYEEQVTMHPLSFREFVRNAGIGEDVLSYVQAQLRAFEPLLPTVHDAMRSLYLQYLIVGGMPEAASMFFERHDLNAVREVQQGVLASIRDDFGRYRNARGEDAVNEVLKLRAEACLDSLPAQLAKEYKKFQYSKVDVRGNSPQKADGLQYLVDVGLVSKAYNLREISSPLDASRISREFKVFYVDTGLLMSQLAHGTAAQVLRGEIGAYKGAIAENMVASAFNAEGLDLYYYHTPSGSPELDFVANLCGQPTLVECKASNKRATSMRFVLDNPKRFGTHPAIKFADANVGGGKGFRTLPLYALGFLEEPREPLVVSAVHIELPQ